MRKIIIIVALLLSNLYANAEIITINNLDSPVIEQIIEWANRDTLAFVELDNTLMMPKSSMFAYGSSYRQFIDNLIFEGKDTPLYNDRVAKWYTQRQIRPVEDGWSNIINTLKDKEAAVYGICSVPVELLNIEERRHYEIESLNITFTKSISQQTDFVIGKRGNKQSRFYKGIVFTGIYSKALTLLDFFRTSGNVPPKILVIVSSEHEAKSINDAMRIFNADYKVILYLGIRNIKQFPSEAIVKLQQQKLIRDGIWLEDGEAARLLDKQK